MDKQNVVSMGDFREFKELKRSGDGYSKYLKTLQDTQLGSETNFLLDEFSNGVCGKEFSQKVQLVLQEITSRADTECKQIIRSISKDTIRLL